MFPSKPSSVQLSANSSQLRGDSRQLTAERVHEECWYGRRTSDLPPDIGCHTIENGELLYCAHPMWFPVVGRQFDVRNCNGCEYFRPRHR